jgi:hypothetical protein
VDGLATRRPRKLIAGKREGCEKGGGMSEPIVFFDTWKLRDGKLEEYRRAAKEFVEFVAENEPQLIAYNVYINQEARTPPSSKSTPTRSPSSSTGRLQAPGSAGS